MHKNATQHRAVEDRRLRLSELRLAGVRDQDELARRLGVDRSTISRDLKALDALYLARAGDNTAIDKGIQHDRIEALIAELWPDANAQHLFTVDRVIALLEREAKLLGLDAPAKQEQVGPVAVRILEGINLDDL